MKKLIIIITIIIVLISTFTFIKYHGALDGSDPDIKYNLDHTFGLHSEERALRVYSNWMTGTGVIYWQLNESLSNDYNDIWDYYMIRLINWDIQFEHTTQETIKQD